MAVSKSPLQRKFVSVTADGLLTEKDMSGLGAILEVEVTPCLNLSGDRHWVIETTSGEAEKLPLLIKNMKKARSASQKLGLVG